MKSRISAFFPVMFGRSVQISFYIMLIFALKISITQFCADTTVTVIISGLHHEACTVPLVARMLHTQ